MQAGLEAELVQEKQEEDTAADPKDAEDTAEDAEFTQVTEDADGQIRTAEYEEIHVDSGKDAASDQTPEEQPGNDGSGDKA